MTSSIDVPDAPNVSSGLPANLPANLPAGLTTRPIQKSDSRVLYDLIAAQELHDTGSVDIEEADLISDWARPSADVTTSSVGVYDDERLVAYAEIMYADRADAAVHPDHRGRGIGTWLAAWIRDMGTARGSRVMGMPMPQGSDGDRLMEGLGYRVRWTSWILSLPEGAEIPARPLPEGYSVREATPEEYVAVHDVKEDAFLEWSDRDREPFDDFRAGVLERPNFEPWNARVVIDADGAVAATAIVHLSDQQVAYIAVLATRKDQRNLGLAQALLVDSFAVGRAHGATVSELSTDSRTGALTLYEKVGMVVHSTWVNRAVDL